MRVHEKARSQGQASRETERGKEVQRQDEGEDEAGSEDGSQDGSDGPEALALHPGADQGRRLAAVPLPAPVVSSRRPMPAGSMLRPILLLVVLLAGLPAAARAEDRPLRLVTFNLLHGGPWAAFTGDDEEL